VSPKVPRHSSSGLGHDFWVHFHVLPLCGVDLVLGVEWLKSLGSVLMNYNKLNMKFHHVGRVMELKGDHDSGVGSITTNQLCHLMKTNATSEFFHLRVEPPSTQTPQSSLLMPEIKHLLRKFQHMFQALTTLPPSRTTNHAINYHPNSEPANVHPYRYPHFQKQEIELQVKSMLRNGVIRLSTSPFSSLVLLVKKRDDSWHFCVDYHALNAIMIKDRFSIPMVDELLDELRGAQWFLKLDLLQGYHQILMKDDDVSRTGFCTHHGH